MGAVDASSEVQDRRRSRWDAHRRARRAELVDAAIAAIHGHGPTIGMEHVAAAAGTSKTVVYRYFGDKTGLYEAVCARVADSLISQLRRAVKDTDTPRAMVSAAIEAYLRVIESDPQVFRFVVHPPPLDRPVDADPVAGLSAVIGDHVASLIAARLRMVGADPSPAGPWRHGLVGLVRDAGQRWVDAGFTPERAVLTAQLTALAWGGLAEVLPGEKNR